MTGVHIKDDSIDTTHGCILYIEGVTVSFDGFKALNDLNLYIDDGELRCIIGPNGAGKTTTIKILAGLLKPDTGNVLINGYNLAEEPVVCKLHTGHIPDRPFLYEKLTGDEFLRFIASLYNLSTETFEKNVDRLLTLFDLTDWQDHLIESY